MIDASTPSVYVSASTQKANRPADAALLGSGTYFKPIGSDTSPTLTFVVDATDEVTVRKVTLSVIRGTEVTLTVGGDDVETPYEEVSTLMKRNG